MAEPSLAVIICSLLDVLDIEVDVMNSEVRLLKSKSDQLLNKYKLLIDIGKYNF